MSGYLGAASTTGQGGGVGPSITPRGWWLLLPELLCLVQDLRALHPQEEEHCHYGQQCRHCVCDDVRKWIVIRDKKNVEDCGGGEVPGQQAARVGQHRLGVDDGQAEEGDRPHPVKYLERDEGRHGEELVCEHQEHHLARDQKHHPGHQEFFPRKLSVEPFCKDLDVA